MLYRGLPQALVRFQAAHPAVRVTLTELNSAELDCRLLVSEPFVACLPAGHRLARKRAVAVGQLKDEPFVLFSRSASPDYHARILSVCADAGFYPEVRMQVRHWLAVVSLVSQGMGVALVPDAMRHCALPGAVFRPLAGSGRQSEAYGVWQAASRNVLVPRLLEELAAHPDRAGRAAID